MRRHCGYPAVCGSNVKVGAQSKKEHGATNSPRTLMKEAGFSLAAQGSVHGPTWLAAHTAQTTSED